jgi:hypothetical protein
MKKLKFLNRVLGNLEKESKVRILLEIKVLEKVEQINGQFPEHQEINFFYLFRRNLLC